MMILILVALLMLSGLGLSIALWSKSEYRKSLKEIEEESR